MIIIQNTHELAYSKHSYVVLFSCALKYDSYAYSKSPNYKYKFPNSIEYYFRSILFYLFFASYAKLFFSVIYLL